MVETPRPPAPDDSIREATKLLVEEGARAVVLTGSHARTAASIDSDIDIVAIGSGRPASAMSVVGGQLFSIAWRTEGEERAAMRDPARVGTVVPAWRSVRLLHDPDGIAAMLRAEARRWTWQDVDAACDRWFAEQVAAYAEEVHKLVGARRRGDALVGGTQRSILALRLGPIMAVARRILYESENLLWHLLHEELGEPWASTQERALGLHGESLDESATAALELYRLVALEADEVLDAEQRAVVERALGRIGPAAQFPPRSGVGFVGLRTDRYDEMVALFRDRIGLQTISEAPGAAWFRLDADAELHVYADSDPDHAFFTTGPVVGLRVEDVKATRTALEADGLEMLTDIERGATVAWCHFRAPDGTVLEIIGPAGAADERG